MSTNKEIQTLYYTADEACTTLGISRVDFLFMVREGQIQQHDTNSVFRYSKAEIDDLATLLVSQERDRA